MTITSYDNYIKYEEHVKTYNAHDKRQLNCKYFSNNVKLIDSSLIENID